MYSANADLQDLFAPEPLERSITRVTERVGERLTETVRRNTPVAVAPPGLSPTQFAGGRGRAPGTLKNSWQTSDVEHRRTAAGTPGRAIESYTLDPIAPHVEYPTRPHLIRPSKDRRAASVLATSKRQRAGGDPQAALRFVNAHGRVVFANEVHHPGTQGTHMMRDALAEVDATWAETVGRDELERWALEQARLVR
jgi:hypothetical protein